MKTSFLHLILGTVSNISRVW